MRKVRCDCSKKKKNTEEDQEEETAAQEISMPAVAVLSKLDRIFTM